MFDECFLNLAGKGLKDIYQLKMQDSSKTFGSLRRLFSKHLWECLGTWHVLSLPNYESIQGWPCANSLQKFITHVQFAIGQLGPQLYRCQVERQNARKGCPIEGQKESQNECKRQEECQNDCPEDCQFEFQNICQIERQKGCQNICQIDCKADCQKRMSDR